MTKKPVILFILLLIQILSCKKEDQKLHEKCSKNCSEINIQGRVVEKPANKGVSNLPISLKWVNYNNFMSAPKLIAETKTDANGNFIFSAGIDTSYIHDTYNLHVIIPEMEDKIILSDVGEEDYRFRIREYPKSPLLPIEFKIYEKAKLDIYLKRVHSDSLDAVEVTIQFPYYGVVHVYGESKRFADTLAYAGARTAANVFTKVTVKKKYKGVWSEISDSIKCAPSINNTIQMNY